MKEMYEGNEKLKLDGKELNFTMIDFWKMNLTNILFNMTRGAFAEFVVRSALEYGGFPPDREMQTGVEPYDLNGPKVFAKRMTKDGWKMGWFEHCRIEIKSTASVQHNTPDEKEPISLAPSRITFGIGKRIDWELPDELQDKRRNSDLYVFCHYTAERKTDNILDLSYWDFYVYPTYKIDNDIDTKLSDQKTISLRRLQMIGVKKCSFAELYDEVLKTVDEISEYYKQNATEI